MGKEEVSKEQVRPKTSVMTNFVLIIGFLAAVSVLVVGFLTYRYSVELIEHNVHETYLKRARTLASLVENNKNLGDEELLARIRTAWIRSGPKPDDEYICVVDDQADLVLHSADPDTIGNYAGNNNLNDMDDNLVCTLKDLVTKKSEYVGRYISSKGEKQIAAFVYIPGRNLTLGVHRRLKAVRKEVRKIFRLPLIGFLIAGGLIVPLALALLQILISRYNRRIKTSENEIRLYGERLKLITDNLPALISYVDKDLRYRFTNKRYETWYGLTSEQIYGQHLKDLIKSEVYQTMEPYLEKALAGEQVEYETILENKDGTTSYLNSKVVPHIDQDGLVIGLYALVSDLTPLRQMQEVLRVIATTSSAASGYKFIDFFTKYLNKILRAKYTFIGVFSETQVNTINTISLFADGKKQADISYNLEGTPCDQVIKKGICNFPRNVASEFPKDQLLKDLAIQGYMGVPLFDQTGQPIGIMVAMYTEPMKERKLIESLFNAFAGRIGREIELIQANKAKKHWKKNYSSPRSWKQ